jgi:hypothetical protein
MATRLWFDREVDIPYTANPAWGFDKGVGMTFFDIRTIQAPAHDEAPGSVVEVDFYHAGRLLGMTDEAIVEKVHLNLGAMLPAFRDANVVDSGRRFRRCPAPRAPRPEPRAPHPAARAPRPAPRAHGCAPRPRMSRSD